LSGHPECPSSLIIGVGVIDEIIFAFHVLVPEYAGKGRLLTRLKPNQDWHYLQMIKHHGEHGFVKSILLYPVWVSWTN
jgi:hypothetical protein